MALRDITFTRPVPTAFLSIFQTAHWKMPSLSISCPRPLPTISIQKDNPAQYYDDIHPFTSSGAGPSPNLAPRGTHLHQRSSADSEYTASFDNINIQCNTWEPNYRSNVIYYNLIGRLLTSELAARVICIPIGQYLCSPPPNVLNKFPLAVTYQPWKRNNLDVE